MPVAAPAAVSAPPAAPTEPATATAPAAATSPAPPATAGSPEAVRWGPFCCLLAPAAFAVYGTRFGSAAFWTIGLAAVTVGCRLLLHRSALDTARTADGAHRGGR